MYKESRMWLLKHEPVGLDSKRGVVCFYGFFCMSVSKEKFWVYYGFLEIEFVTEFMGFFL